MSNDIHLGLKLRHDLVGENGKAARARMGLALIELGEVQAVKKQSAVSDEHKNIIAG
jgi:hypothetical protein